MEKSSNIWFSIGVIIIVIMAGMYILGYNKNINTTDLGTESESTLEVSENNTDLTLIMAEDPQLGSYFTAPNGMSLYTFKKDAPGKSNCVDTCATNWPPYVVSSVSDVSINPEIAGTIGTITRNDGSLQVTYNSMPLYFWSKDSNPGDVTGHNVGGVWFLAK